MSQKIEKLREVKTNLVTILNELEVYIFTENIDKYLDKGIDMPKTPVVNELKQ